MKLVDAVKQGNVQEVKRLLEWATDHQKSLALRAAIENKQKNVMLTLLHSDIKIKVDHLKTAIKIDDEDVINWILKNKNAPALSTSEDFAPLMMATKQGNANVVRALVKAGIQVNLTDNNGRTAFQNALVKGNFEIAKILIEEGKADIDLVGFDAQIIAVVKNATNTGALMINLLLENGIEIKQLDLGKKPILVYAARETSDSNVLEVLLKHGADPNVCDEKGRHVLRNAIDKGKAENATVLVRWGAKLQFSDSELRTLVRNSGYDLFRPAYDAHNAIAVHKFDLITGLIEAVLRGKHGEYEVGKFIKIGKVDVNAKNGDQKNAITFAIEKKNLRMVRYLIEHHGARMEIPSDTLVNLLKSIDNETKDLFELIITSNCRETEEGRNALGEALIFATSNNYMEDCYNLIKSLLAHGADPDYMPRPNKKGTGFPPLLLATDKDDIRLVQKLLEYNADVNIQDEFGYTALMKAAANGNLEVLRLLLQRNANPEVAKDGIPSARYQIDRNAWNYEEMYDLLSKAEDENRYDHVDISYFPIAVISKFDRMIWNKVHEEASEKEFIPDEGYGKEVDELLGGRKNLDRPDEYSRTLLMFCSFMKYHLFVKHLLTCGASVSLYDVKGMTALTWATLGGSHEAMELLIANKANVEAADNFWRTALFRAIQKKDDKACEILIKAGGVLASEPDSELNIARPHELVGAVVWAAKNNRSDVVRKLVKSEFKMNQSLEFDEHGRTPLMIVAAGGNEEFVTEIIPLDFYFQKMDNSGCTPLWHAMHNNHLGIFKILLKSGASTKFMHRKLSALTVTTLEGRTEYVRAILEHNPDMKLKDEDGTSPLMHACKHGHTEIARLLVEHGAETRTSNNRGEFALLYAAERNAVEIVKILIKAKAPLNQCNAHERTALTTAAANCFHEIVEALLMGGADAKQKDGNGMDAMHLALNGDIRDPGRAHTLQELIAMGGNCDDWNIDIEQISEAIENVLSGNNAVLPVQTKMSEEPEIDYSQIKSDQTQHGPVNMDVQYGQEPNYGQGTNNTFYLPAFQRHMEVEVSDRPEVRYGQFVREPFMGTPQQLYSTVNQGNGFSNALNGHMPMDQS